jgi:hypothetical protein
MALSLLTSLSGHSSPVSPSRVKPLTPVFSPFGTGVFFSSPLPIMSSLASRQ